MPPVSFAVHSYRSRSLPVSAQRCVNYFAEAEPPDAKTLVAMLNSPGIMSFCDSLAGAVRGSHVMNGVLYVVAGNVFYSVSSAGAATSIGAITTSSGNISMASNRASPQQLCFVDGTAGWIYDTSGGLAQITDAQFAAADTVTFQDGYFIFNKAGSSQFFLSAIDDGTNYAATDFADAESNADETVAVYSNRQTLIVFGEITTEFYYNSGNNDFPFERIAGGVMQRGCAAAFSVASDDNTLFWLGEDRIVYRLNGFAPLRVSTHAIEEDLRTMMAVDDAYGFFVTISGHKLYHLSFPTGRKTYVYDTTTNLWHERESFGQRHWRGVAYARAYGKDLIGDAFVGRLGELDMDTFTEFGDTMQGILTGPVIHNDRRRAFHRRFEVDVEVGTGTAPLVSETLTNLILQSETLDEDGSGNPWTYGGTTSSVTANAVDGPNGNLIADKIVEGTGTGAHYIVQTFTGAAATQYTASAYVKAAERTEAYIQFDPLAAQAGSEMNCSAMFDLSTGAVSSTPPSGNYDDYGIIDAGNGWYRIWITSSTINGSGTESVQIGYDTVGAGDGTSGIYATMVQLEAAASPGIYIKTLGTTASKTISYHSNTEPQMWLDYSDDGGRTWTVRKPFRSMGAVGQYRQRLRWLRLGQARDRIYRLTVADSVKRTVIAAHADIMSGSN